jgi:hypothetical protein
MQETVANSFQAIYVFPPICVHLKELAHVALKA